MKRFPNRALNAIIVLLVLLLGVSAMVPVLEVHGYYCFYCGLDTGTCKLLGVPVWRKTQAHGLYKDTLQTPAHSHRFLDLCGFRIWLFRGSENWDEFGWTGSGCRQALIAGLNAYPNRRDQILKQFMGLDPQDREATLHFVKAYRKMEESPKANQPTKSD